MRKLRFIWGKYIPPFNKPYVYKDFKVRRFKIFKDSNFQSHEIEAKKYRIKLIFERYFS